VVGQYFSILQSTELAYQLDMMMEVVQGADRLFPLLSRKVCLFLRLAPHRDSHGPRQRYDENVQISGEESDGTGM